MIGFLNRGTECLLRGMPWVFILDRMCFVFKGLKLILRLAWDRGLYFLQASCATREYENIQGVLRPVDFRNTFSYKW
jgi:hypothetical protein